MPRRDDIDSVLIIGAGPIVIGQACEFDYSGTQACKALKEEGYRVILVNSNPATIMTDPASADAIYIEPIHWQTLERIIEKERPSALLPTMGGQTGLNCALDLDSEGILEKYGVELIAASRASIEMAEDRAKFRVAMEEIGLTLVQGVELPEVFLQLGIRVSRLVDFPHPLVVAEERKDRRGPPDPWLECRAGQGQTAALAVAGGSDPAFIHIRHLHHDPRQHRRV